MTTLQIFWAALGVGLWGLELFAPGLVAGAIGTAALAMLLIGPLLPSFVVQLVVFALLAAGLILLSRRLVPRPDPQLEERFYREKGEVIAAIEPGRMGRVSFQGTTWNARCEVESLPLATGTPVLITGREGNVLQVMPLDLLK